MNVLKTLTGSSENTYQLIKSKNSDKANNSDPAISYTSPNKGVIKCSCCILYEVDSGCFFMILVVLCW